MTRDEQLEAIYARIPKMRCKGLCSECCGPIGMSRAEMKRIVERVSAKVQPILIGAQATLCSKSLTCPLLANGRCTIYDIRPLICRIWGGVKAMRCPHGCKPKRWMSKDETYALLSEAESIAP